MKLTAAICGSAIVLTGCGVGTSNMLIATRTSAGIEVSASPPAFEAVVGRSEGVIAPSFEGGRTPPVIAGFQSAGGGVFAGSASSALAAGDAALVVATLWNDDESSGGARREDFDSTLVLAHRPEGVAEGAPVRPMVFSTDTSLGLKIAWTGAASVLPDTLRIGFHRKEMAWAPVTCSSRRMGRDGREESGHFVASPSLLASIDAGADARTPTGTRAAHSQCFATGEAATRLAMKRGVRRAILPRLDPAAAEHSAGTGFVASGEDESADRLRAWLDADDANRARFRRWLNDRGVRASVAFVVNDRSMRSVREAALADGALGAATRE